MFRKACFLPLYFAGNSIAAAEKQTAEKNRGEIRVGLSYSRHGRLNNVVAEAINHTSDGCLNTLRSDVNYILLEYVACRDAVNTW